MSPIFAPVGLVITPAAQLPVELELFKRRPVLGSRHVRALVEGTQACEDDLVTHVRLASQHDLDELVEKDRIPEEELEVILRRSRILVAEDGSGDGFIGWLRWGLFWDELPFMNRLHVDEPRRGEGVGRLLVSHWEQACARDGHTTVMTSTVSAESAQHFYRKLGYADAGCLILPGESAEIFFLKQIV